MKRRIKVLYLVTIAAIVAYGLLEGYWLKQRYAAAVVEQEKDVFEKVVGELDSYFAAQRKPTRKDVGRCKYFECGYIILLINIRR